MAQGRDELGRFTADIQEASERLRSFSREVDDSAKATANKTKEEKAAEKERTDTLNSRLGFASNSIGQVASTGEFSSIVSGATRAGIHAIRDTEIEGVKVGEYAAEVSGLNRAERILGSAADRTSAVTGDLARYGIEVSDSFRSGLLQTQIEQEKRVDNERAKVSAEAFGPGNVAGLVGDQGSRLLGAVEKIASLIDRLTGGSS